MRQVLQRTLAYLLGGFGLGAAAWGLIFEQPFDASSQNQTLAVALLVPALVVAGVLLFRVGYPVASGPGSSPGASIVASDMVCIVAAALAIFFIVDGFSERFGGPPAEIADPLASDVIVVMLVPAALVLSFFVTQIASQSVAADAAGVTVSGLGNTTMIPWADIESIQPDKQYVAVGRMGFLVPRHLRTNLKINLRNGTSISVIDPQTQSGRGAILREFEGAMPPGKKALLDEAYGSWQCRI